MHHRDQFFSKVERLLDASRKDENVLAYLVIKLKKFKDINTTYSIETGDKLINKLEEQLNSALRPTDVLSRTGDSEFGLILPALNNASHALLAANKLINVCTKPIAVDSVSIEPVLVIGVSIANYGMSHNELIQNSTLALMEAESANESYRLYEPELDRSLPPKLILENEMHYAYGHDEFDLHYQPKIDLKSQSVVGAEALIRWHSSKYGFVNTQYFVDMLEESNMLMSVTKWVLNKALRKCEDFRSVSEDFSIAVNLSPTLLTNNDIVDVVVGAVNIWGVDPKHLVLEVTEGAMMTNPEVSLNILQQLESHGLGVSIDDFGTGYSSLSYLKHLPAQELKIDRSFVMNMLEDEKNKSIVKAAIDLAHNLGLSVVAEGIESEEVLQSLVSIGCDFGQGYHIAKPMPEDNFKQWLLDSPMVKHKTA